MLFGHSFSSSALSFYPSILAPCKTLSLMTFASLPVPHGSSTIHSQPCQTQVDLQSVSSGRLTCRPSIITFGDFPIPLWHVHPPHLTNAESVRSYSDTTSNPYDPVGLPGLYQWSLTTVGICPYGYLSDHTDIAGYTSSPPDQWILLNDPILLFNFV